MHADPEVRDLPPDYRFLCYCWQKLKGALEEGVLKEHHFDTGTVVINYAEGPSSGKPLVLLHGGAGSWRSYLATIPHLISDWHIYAPDFRGHGQSGHVPGAYRWMNFVQDKTIFLTHHFSEPVILWGSSFGGTVALGVAAQAPDAVRALVLEDAWLDLQTSKEQTRQFLRYRRDLVASVRSLDKMVEALKNELVAIQEGNAPIRRGELDEDAQIRLEAEMLLQLDPEVYAFGWDGRLAEGYNMEEVLGRVTCPTLLLQADSKLGGLVDDDLASMAMGLLRQGTLVSIPDAQHAIFQSQPDAAMREINKFLASV